MLWPPVVERVTLAVSAWVSAGMSQDDYRFILLNQERCFLAQETLPIKEEADGALQSFLESSSDQIARLEIQ